MLDAHVPSLTRRCPECSAIAVRTERGYVCADPLCARPVGLPIRGPFNDRRYLLACPRCLAPAGYDRQGALVCTNPTGAHRVPVPRQEPPSGWEGCFTEEAVRERHPALGLAGAPTWDGYGGPSRLETLWGKPGDEGRERVSVAGARLMALVDAYDARLELLHRLRDRIEACAKRLRTGDQRVRGARDLPDRFTALVAEASAVVQGHLMALRILVENDLLRLTGRSEEAIHARLRRTTPFSGYRHAIAFHHGDHGTLVLGAGSPLAGLSDVEMAPLARGVRLGEIAVNPSHASSGRARNEAVLHLHFDVVTAVGRARVGGVWEPPAKDAPPGTPWTCHGGRKLTPVEQELLRLCDTDQQVGKGQEREVRSLKLPEALERMRHDRTYAEVRRFGEKDAEQFLRAARRAVIDALVAHGLIPPPVRRPRRAKPVEEEPRGWRGRPAPNATSIEAVDELGWA